MLTSNLFFNDSLPNIIADLTEREEKTGKKHKHCRYLLTAAADGARNDCAGFTESADSRRKLRDFTIDVTDQSV